jgi:gas vesicle protein
MMENRNTGGSMEFGLAAGLAIGLAISLLYVPRSGKETRAILRERAIEVKEKAGEMAEDIKKCADFIIQLTKELPAG